MADKEQFKLMVEPQLRARLDRLAQRLGIGANEFAVQALEDYGELLADLMAEVREQSVLLRKRQREQLLGKESQEPSRSRK